MDQPEEEEEVGVANGAHSVQFPTDEDRLDGRRGRERVAIRRPQRTSEPSLVMALAKSFVETFLVAAFFKLCQDLLSFVSPQLLKYVLTNI